MTQQVWKYSLTEALQVQAIEMPAAARLLTVQMQSGVPCLWALVDTEAPRVERQIAIIGTGHTLPPHWGTFEYIGTFQTMGGVYVWHAFEVREE